MSVRSDAAVNHRTTAEGFGQRVRGADPARWGDPSPVEGWDARDVVRHLVTWLPGFLEGGTGIRLSPVPSVDEDPVAAWESHAAHVQELLDDPATDDLVYQSQMFGDLPLAQAIDQFYTTDVFMHTWDLARATQQDASLDEDRCRAIYEGMLPMDEVLRQSDQFGPRVDVPEDASYQDKLIAFIGRQP
jgi:uncharacterized protein (TIGR03086 family)